MALFSTESSRGWVSFKDGVWEECEVKNSDANNLTLQLVDGSTKTFPRKQVQFCYRNPSAVEAVDDFLTLPHLDEPKLPDVQATAGDWLRSRISRVTQLAPVETALSDETILEQHKDDCSAPPTRPEWFSVEPDPTPSPATPTIPTRTLHTTPNMCTHHRCGAYPRWA